MATFRLMLFQRKRREIAPSKPLLLALGILAGEALAVGGLAIAQRINDWIKKGN